jgi:arylformamidase
MQESVPNSQKIFDISPIISETTDVWPGDIALTRQIQGKLADGSSVDLSSISTTVHIGAHADAPSHYHKDGVTIDAVDLEPYLGPCQVITVKTSGAITRADCEQKIIPGMKRVLFRTLSQPDPQQFPAFFAYLSAEVVTFLGQLGTKLVGIDTPSVDPFDSKDLPAHNALYLWQIRNLEGLDLRTVPDGAYELIALPLRLARFDASPVRAILRSF